MNTKALGTLTFGQTSTVTHDVYEKNDLTITATIVDSGASAVDVSTGTAIRLTRLGETAAALDLDQGDSQVIVGGAGSNEIAIVLSASDMTITPGTYTAEIQCTESSVVGTVARIKLTVLDSLF